MVMICHACNVDLLCRVNPADLDNNIITDVCEGIGCGSAEVNIMLTVIRTWAVFDY